MQTGGSHARIGAYASPEDLVVAVAGGCSRGPDSGPSETPNFRQAIAYRLPLLVRFITHPVRGGKSQILLHRVGAVDRHDGCGHPRVRLGISSMAPGRIRGHPAGDLPPGRPPEGPPGGAL